MLSSARSRFRAVLVVSVAFAAIVFAGCGGAASDTATSRTSSSDTPASAGPPAAQVVGLVGGGQIDLNSMEGSDTVFWFWAPW